MQVHPLYRQAIETTEIRQEGTMRPDLTSASLQGVSLGFSVSPEGLVTEAFHTGARHATRAILERLCRLAMGRPLAEVAEHGLIYVEFGMREAGIAPPVPGLVTPENGDPAFGPALTLARQCWAAYRAQAPTERNSWSPAPGANWAGMNQGERIGAVKNCLKDFHSTLSVEVLKILEPTRVVVSLAEAQLTGAALGHALMEIELELKARLEPTIELILESSEDRNQRLKRSAERRSPSEAQTS